MSSDEEELNNASEEVVDGKPLTAEEKAAAKKKKKKEKEREKKKKEKEKKDGGDKKDGGKKKNKQADLIRELLQKRQEAEEAERKRIEEEERKEEELRKAKEEEERRELQKKEDAKRRKAELIQQQKKEGTFQTKKQRQQAERARTLFQNQNIVLPSAVTGEAEDKPKKPYYGKKKPQKKISQPESTTTTAVTAEKSETPVEEKEEKLEEVKEDKIEKIYFAFWVVDDWEQLSDVDDSETPETAAADVSKPSSTTTAVSAVAAVEEKKPAEKKETAGKVERITKAADIGKRGSVESESSESSADEEDDDDSSSFTSEYAPSTATSTRETKEMLFAKVRAKIAKRHELAMAKKDPNNLRAPIICVLGHVDTGKTKMLDTIRRTNVQDGEAGGITQQIGATEVPAKALVERCKLVKDFDVDSLKLPGFLIIDTPGHESFANLRSRGSSLCDIAILVVDIMHGLEPQTIESLKLLLKRKTPFVVALNKVDRLYGYESNPRKDVYQHLKAQATNVQLEFKERWEKITAEFAEQGLNVALSKDNKDYDEYISVVPTSAQLGDGIGNLLAHIVQQCQNRFFERLIFVDELDCTVMEVRTIPGLGTTIDVILVNGRLRNDDIIVLSGIDGPIVTPIRDLLTPPPLRESRIKSDYYHYKEIKGAQGVKVLAKDLEKAVAGLPIFVAQSNDELEILKEDAEEQLSKALMAIKKKPEGVYVQASTLGSLEALLEFLKTQKIPYSNVNIGPVHKKDVQKASAMLEHNKEFACILAFDVPITREAQQVADKEGVRIFKADIIYHLENDFLKYREELRLKRRKENEHLAIYPVKMRVLPQNIFNARNPIVIGVSIEAGHLKKGTPICANTPEGVIFLGTVSSIERNHDQMDVAKTGDEVCIKIDNTTGEAPKLYGRHFTFTDLLISRLSRESIDVCKAYFRDDLSKADWQLIVELKKVFGIL